MPLKQYRKPNPNLVLIINFLKSILPKTKIKDILPVLTPFGAFILGVLIVVFTQTLVSRREITIRRVELTSELFGSISYIRYCWINFYNAENEQKYMLDRYLIYKDTLALYQWKDIQNIKNQFLSLAIEARRDLLELLQNIKLYFPDKRRSHDIIDSCNWYPRVEYPSFLELSDEKAAQFKDIDKWWVHVENSTKNDITDYFQPLYILVDSLKMEVDREGLPRSLSPRK
ncbi:MAG: hypothetical protein JSV97_06785 [candidate division WOR-3 bacterium]|nr:MAG: hypothetical protein JSV97_06785 [candidate division WOR-3 bacterium]